MNQKARAAIRAKKFMTLRTPRFSIPSALNHRTASARTVDLGFVAPDECGVRITPLSWLNHESAAKLCDLPRKAYMKRITLFNMFLAAAFSVALICSALARQGTKMDPNAKTLTIEGAVRDLACPVQNPAGTANNYDLK